MEREGEVEVVPAGEPAPIAEPAAEPKGTEHGETHKTNAWTATKEAIARLADGETPTDKDKDAPASPESKPTDKTAEPSKTPEGEGAKPKDEKPPLYTVVDASGVELEAEWPEGAVLRFKGDKKQVEVKSYDELVTLAQKGVFMDRRAADYNAAERRWQSERESAQTQLREAEELVAKVVTDREAFRKVRAVVLKYKDPEYREGREAKAALDAKAVEEAAGAEAQTTEQVSAFWEKVGDEFTSRLAKYPTLDEDDRGEVITAFSDLANRTFDELVVEYRANASSMGLTSEEAVVAAAEREALKVLTEDNLDRVMKQRHERYVKKGAQPKPKLSEEDAKREAAAHDKRVKDKLEQRSRQTLRGGAGSAPAGRTGDDDERPATFAEQKDRMFAELRKAAEPSR